VNADGHREILGLQVTSAEDGAGWLGFFRDLTARGLTGVALVTSDAHRGLTEAIGPTLPGAAWQRCRTHGAANLMSVTPKASWPWVRTLLHSVYDQPDAASVHAPYDRPIDAIASKLPDVARHLEDARDDLLAFTSFPKELWRQIWSNNQSYGNFGLRVKTGTPASTAIGVTRRCRRRRHRSAGPVGLTAADVLTATRHHEMNRPIFIIPPPRAAPSDTKRLDRDTTDIRGNSATDRAEGSARPAAQRAPRRHAEDSWRNRRGRSERPATQASIRRSSLQFSADKGDNVATARLGCPGEPTAAQNHQSRVRRSAEAASVGAHRTAARRAFSSGPGVTQRHAEGRR
jgi:hypothetical protein